MCPVLGVKVGVGSKRCDASASHDARYFPTDQTNPWVYYYSTAYRSPEDAATYEQFVKQDQASRLDAGGIAWTSGFQSLLRRKSGRTNP